MTFTGRLAIQQRVLPVYRTAFFDSLAAACPGGLSVLAGQPRPGEAIEVAAGLTTAQYTHTSNRHFLSGGFYLYWQAGLGPWLERWDPQALIVETNPRNLSNAQAIRWMKARRRPVIGWGLGSPAIHGLLSGARLRMRRQYIHSFDGLIAYSQPGADSYRSLGFPAGRIWVAPNAVTHRPSWPLPIREGHATTKPVVLFVGRLQARKKVDNLIQACARLPIETQPRLWIVGDGPEKASLENQARALYPAAEFFGARHGDELAPLFNEADLFVLPGTGGLAIQEAMAHGLPVIAAEADGTQLDLVRPENGWQVPPGHVEALVSALNQALSDPARLRTMGAASYQIVSQEINLEAMVRTFLDALTECQRAYEPQA